VDCFVSDETVIMTMNLKSLWRRGGLMVSVLASGLSGLGLCPGQGHCVEQDTELLQCLSLPRGTNKYQ